MMSDEEKKAIKKVKRIIERYEHKPIEKITVEFDEFDYNLFKTILNLIEKQSKEIEYWKEQAEGYSDLEQQIKELKETLKCTQNSWYEDTRVIEIQKKEIESLKKENLEIRDWKYTIDTIEDLDKLKELDLIKIKGKEYLSKDKIRAKIEELEKEQKDNRKRLYNAVNILCFKEIDKISNKICVNMTVRDILQSLLEEE